jgi:HlyD family secretion protein
MVHRKMKRVLYIIIVIILGFAFIQAFGLFKKSNKNYRTALVERGEITSFVTATGTLNALTTVQVGSQVSGTIKKVFVDFNSPVKKGQVITQIDPSLFEAQLSQAEANMKSAIAAVEKAKASETEARRNLERSIALFSAGIISRSDLDTAQTNLDLAVAGLNVLIAQSAQAEAALRLTKTNLSYTKIISPVDGIVISRNVDVGQTVASSFQTPTLFTIAQDLTKMRIDTSVDEADIGEIRIGQEVDFTVDAYPEMRFKGEVSQVRNAPVIVQNVVTYNAVIEIANPDLKLKPGMTANVSIKVAHKDNVLKVPNAALRFRPEGIRRREGQPVLWILDKGDPKPVTVKLGISDRNFTELVEGNIREGEELIVEAISKKTSPRPQRGPRFM